jgi:hypothetical protein
MFALLQEWPADSAAAPFSFLIRARCRLLARRLTRGRLTGDGVQCHPATVARGDDRVLVPVRALGGKLDRAR